MEAYEDEHAQPWEGTPGDAYAYLHGRLTEWFDTRDPGTVLATGPLCAAATLLRLAGELLYADEATEAPLAAAHLAGVLLQSRLEALGDDASDLDHHAWISVLGVIHALDPELIPGPLADAFAAEPPPVPPLHDLLAAFAHVLLQDHARNGDATVLGSAVLLLREAEEAAPESARPQIWSNLGLAWQRMAGSGEGDTDTYLKLAAYELGRAARAAHAHPQRAYMCYELGNVEMARFDATGDLQHLDDAIDAQRAMVADGSPEPGWWFLLGASLMQRFRLTGIRKYLDEAIDATATDIRLMPPGHPTRPGVLGSLGSMLLARYAAGRDPADLDAALSAALEAERTVPPGHPQYAELHDNARMLRQLHHQAMNGAAEPPSALLRREAVAPGALPALATALVARFVRLGDPDDLEAGLRFAVEAVTLLPGDAAALAALSAARYAYALRSADPARLTAAVDAATAALDATAPDDPERAQRLDALAVVLRIRFESQGGIEDLEAALTAARAAVAAAEPESRLHAAAQSNLGAALLARFVTLRRPEDIDDAVTAGREAARHAPAGRDAGHARTNLAAALQTRYDIRGERADLDEAVAALEAATAETPATDVNFPVMRLKLAVALRERGGAEDLDAAVSLLRGMIAEHGELAAGAEDLAAVPGDQNTAHAYAELGYTLEERFASGGGPGPQDLYDAGRAFRLAAATTGASTRTRLFTAFHWGGTGMVRGDAEDALAGYRTAVEELLPRLADRGLTRASRLAQIAQVPLLAGNAAAAAIAAGDLPGAVCLLEQGRSVIWSQLVQTRTDRTELRDQHPALADEFDAVCAALEGDRPPGAGGEPAGGPVRGEQPWQLSARFDALVDRIRRLRHFERFLAPPDFEELRRAADGGPVAVINVSTHRCDALLLRSEPGAPAVELVPLPGVTSAEVERRAAEFVTAVDRLSRPGLDPEALALSGTVTETLRWLGEEITGPVLAALGFDREAGASPSPERTLPRLWWCPTGPLALLPLHAAGPRTGPRVVDRVVSSYAPTLGSLIRARSREQAAAQAPRVLGIGVRPRPYVAGADSYGQRGLPGVSAELATLSEVFGDRHTSRADEKAVLAEVLAALPTHPWVHVACHGIHEPADPAESHLALYDGPLSVAGIAAQDLSGADLAFLSACHTALGTSRLADEAIHLAAAFQLAGFRHVVGTLWTLADGPAPEVARDFYRALEAGGNAGGGGGVGAGGSARALHGAVRVLREDPANSVLQWACYVHLGP